MCVGLVCLSPRVLNANECKLILPQKDAVARFESFKALKLSRYESFRDIKLARYESLRSLKLSNLPSFMMILLS